MASHLNHRIIRISLAVALVVGLTQCAKRKQLEQEIILKNQQAVELKAQQKQIQDAIDLTGNLGRYNATQPKHLDELKGQIASSTQEIQDYKAQRDKLSKEIDDIRTDIDQHRVKYR